jgi:autotransporter-associated beta strand protein
MLSVHTNASIGSLNGGAGSTVTLNGGRLTINQTAPGTYAGLIVDGTFPGGRLVKGGDSTITLAGVNTYTSGTTLLSGGIGIGNNSALGPGVLAVEGNGSLFAAGSNRTIANNISIAVVNTLTVSDDPAGASNTLTLAGNISGLGTLAKVGAGTLILSGTNTQSGGIAISDGRVGIASDGAFGAGAIRVLGAAELFPIGAARTIARTVTVVSGPLIVSDVPGDSFDLTITGVLNAAGGLVKNGANTLVVNNYASAGGTASVNGGTLRFVAATTGSGTYQVNGDGRIQFASNALISPLIIAANDLLSTIEYSSGVRINGGSLFGPGNHVIGTGGATFTGTDLFNGVKLAINAPLTMTAITSGAAIQVANNQTLTWNGGRMSAGGSLTLGQGAVASVRSFESSGRIVIQNGGELDNSGTNLVSGGGGVIEVRAGGILSSPATTIELNGSLLVNNGTVDGTTNVNFGSLAKGAGSFGPVNVSDGGRFSPGNSPGTATLSSLTLGAGGRYEFELNSAFATPGNGADFLNVTGAVNVTSGFTANSRFTIALFSLGSLNQSAFLSDFDPFISRSFTLMTAAGGITGFDPARFSIDTTGFLNNLAGGAFAIAQSGDGRSLELRFNAVPEPSVAMWFVIAGGGILSNRRRR